MKVLLVAAFACGFSCIAGAEVFDDDSAYRWIFEDWDRGIEYVDGITAIYKDQPNNGEYVRECILNSAQRDEIRFFSNTTFTPEGGRACQAFYLQTHLSLGSVSTFEALPINVTGVEAAALAASQRAGFGFVQVLRNGPFAITDPNPGKYKKLLGDFYRALLELRRIAVEVDVSQKCLDLDAELNRLLLEIESTLQDSCAQTPVYR